MNLLRNFKSFFDNLIKLQVDFSSINTTFLGSSLDFFKTFSYRIKILVSGDEKGFKLASMLETLDNKSLRSLESSEVKGTRIDEKDQ